MQNKELKQLTVVEQVLQVMNIDQLKQEIQLNEAFRLDLLFKVSIKDLLTYGEDVAVEGDFSLSYHQAVMKLREQLKQNIVGVSEFTFVSMTNRELHISWYSKQAGIMNEHQLFIDELLEFAQKLDDLKLYGLELRDGGFIFCQTNETNIGEFHILDPDNYERELEPVLMNYRHLDEMISGGLILRHSIVGKQPVEMNLQERYLLDLKLIYDLSGDKEVLREYEILRGMFEHRLI